MERPESGEIRVGMEVFVIQHHGGRTPPPPVKARVSKAARVWLTLESIETKWPCEWRMRRDTQDDGNDFSYRDYFVTKEQLAWEQRQGDAYAFLRKQGIDVRFDSPWHRREIELADLIEKGMKR